MISAPNAPSQRVAHGPARTQLKSTTRMFSRARGRDMTVILLPRPDPGTSDPFRGAYFACRFTPVDSNASGLSSVMRIKRNISTAASPNGTQQNIYTAVTALPTAPGSVASPSPATFATTPAIAAPNAVPIERTEANAEAVLRYSWEVTLSIARATRCTLYTPMPNPRLHRHRAARPLDRRSVPL